MLGLLLCCGGALMAQDKPTEPTRAEYKEQVKKYNEAVEAIKNDPNLTEAEKEEQLKVLRKEATKNMRKNGKYRPGQERSRRDRIKRKGVSSEVQEKLDKIEADESLSDEEKRAAKKVVFEEQRAKWAAERSGKVGSHGNGKEGRMGKDGKGPKGKHGNHKAKGKHAKAKRAKVERMEKKIESGLTVEEKAKVIKRLDKLERKLDKKYGKGKISEKSYQKRKAEIADLRAKL